VECFAEICKRVVEKLCEVECAVKEHLQLFEKLRLVRYTKVGRLELVNIAEPVVLAGRMPAFDAVSGWRCGKAVEIKFYGARIEVGRRAIPLSDLDVDALVDLIGLEVCNPGILDMIVSAVREENGKIRRNLELLKQVVEVAKMLLQR